MSNPLEEFTKITEVVMKYAVHNPTVGFILKKHGEPSLQVRQFTYLYAFLYKINKIVLWDNMTTLLYL